MAVLDRRRMLLTGTAALLAGCGGGGSSAPEPIDPPDPVDPPQGALGALKAAASAKNLGFGAALAAPTTFQDIRYRNLLVEQCNLVVAENDHKWGAIRPTPNDFDFTGGDAIVDFALTEGLDFRFHTLLWEDEVRYPGWFETYDFGANPAAEGERLLSEHIRRVTDHYRGRMVGWDVVNEAVDPATGGYRSSPFSRALGSMEAVLDTAFNTAREQLPDGRLVYNDFMSWGGDATHRDGVLRLLEGMMNRGTPVDALGLQSHVWGGNADGYFPDRAAWRSFLDEVTGMGLGLVLTEFDVDDRDLPAARATRDERVATVARDYLDTTLAYEAVSDVVMWGLVNRYSWLQTFRPRTDGLAKRPLPFDDDYQPTPMAFAIKDAFDAAPNRPAR